MIALIGVSRKICKHMELRPKYGLVGAVVCPSSKIVGGEKLRRRGPQEYTRTRGLKSKAGRRLRSVANEAVLIGTRRAADSGNI